MNNKIKETLFALLILLSGNKVYAYDIAVENADGVTIYYNCINNDTELEVTFGYNPYKGDIVIPSEVTFKKRNLKVTSIGKEAFNEDDDLHSITIPNSVTSIGDWAFEDCDHLTTVNLPNSVTSIGEYAFAYCYSLTFITIPNSVTSIGKKAFAYSYSLTSITIPNGVTSISDDAFAFCSSLTSITIPNSVTSIGFYALYCNNLSIVISQIENPFKLYEYTFDERTYKNATLYVPKGTIDKYKATEGWKDFVFIEEGDGTSSIASDVKSYGVMIQASDGFFNISGAKDGTPISIYNTAGQMVGSAKASSETTLINTMLQNGEIGIVKIGDKSIKVLMK